MTKYEAVVVSAYTGFLIGEFSELHKFIEDILERPVYTHELASKDLFATIKEKAKPYFIKLRVE